MVFVRRAVLPDDAAGIALIDTSFATRQVYDVRVVADSIRLTLRVLGTVLSKRFPLDDLGRPDRPYDRSWVALDGKRIVGFAATSFEPWNRRLVLWHLYVNPSHRGRGIARQLLEMIDDHGRERGARHLWLETSSLNVPGVAAYRALGFSLTGVDMTLYDGTPAEGETAIFLSRGLNPPA
jgi:ribosomal protein S18 acetylase RimI-like enzyme